MIGFSALEKGDCAFFHVVDTANDVNLSLFFEIMLNGALLYDFLYGEFYVAMTNFFHE